MSFLFVLLALVLLVLGMVLPAMKIARKAGLSAAWGLVVIFPLGIVVYLWVLAAGDWGAPSENRFA